MANLIQDLAAEAVVIAKAPWSFAGCVALAGGAIWSTVQFLKAQEIANLKAQLALKVDEVMDYKRRLDGASPTGAQDRIESLERTVKLLQAEPASVAPPKPGEFTAVGTSITSGEPSYEGDHELLMLFVVRHLLPTWDAYKGLVEGVVAELPVSEANTLVGEGLTRRIETSAVQEYMGYLNQLRVKPPKFISLTDMQRWVEGAEKYYSPFLMKMAPSLLALRPNLPDDQVIKPAWSLWHDRDTALNEAYEAIQLNSRLPLLFRPGLPSRWRFRRQDPF